jgi:ATP-dependent exoDNAse (exonuclease V) beta subunit
VRDKEAAEAEIRLFYVAMTRAKETLVVDNSILHAFVGGERLQSALRPASIGLVQKKNLIENQPVQPKRPPEAVTAQQVTRNKPPIPSVEPKRGLWSRITSMFGS